MSSIITVNLYAFYNYWQPSEIPARFSFAATKKSKIIKMWNINFFPSTCRRDMRVQNRIFPINVACAADLFYSILYIVRITWHTKQRQFSHFPCRLSLGKCVIDAVASLKNYECSGSFLLLEIRERRIEEF